MPDEDSLAAQQLLTAEFEISPSGDKDFLTLLGNRINDLIQHDFATLVHVLYRIDVDESKIKEMLNRNPQQDSGHMIAKLILERQSQKIQLRQKFSRDKGTDHEEKW